MRDALIAVDHEALIRAPPVSALNYVQPSSGITKLDALQRKSEHTKYEAPLGARTRFKVYGFTEHGSQFGARARCACTNRCKKHGAPGTEYCVINTVIRAWFNYNCEELG